MPWSTPWLASVHTYGSAPITRQPLGHADAEVRRDAARRDRADVPVASLERALPVLVPRLAAVHDGGVHLVPLEHLGVLEVLGGRRAGAEQS